MQNMKKSFSIISLYFLLLPISVLSQAPQGIPYQAVVRNADGSVMANSVIILTFKVHDIAPNGTVVFEENHTLTSNSQGLVSCIVGNGTVSQGIFTNINWGSGAKFLHVIMGTTDLGTQQMMSVPYALYSGNTNVSVSTTGDTLTIGGQSVIVPGISAANTNNNPISGLGSQVLPGNTTCANEYISITGCNGQTTLTYDSRTYDLVEIGGQCWFADNLATDQYRNGDLIPTGLDNTTWTNTTSGAYAIYNNDPANDATYGKLYNWFTTADSRGICPLGWHVPTDCEWMYLEGSLGMSVANQETVGYRDSVGGSMKVMTLWTQPNTGATNSSSFTALPGGYRNANGSYIEIEDGGIWSSSSEYTLVDSWSRILNYYSSNVGHYAGDKHNGLSIRCIKDSESSPILGCTDGAACNFLANANQDDGSCLYPNTTCDDGNANTTNDVINSSCVCVGIQTTNSGLGSQVLPGNTTCANEYISVTGCNGQTSLTYDGRTYDLVEIGGQCWFADNLATDQYRNGDAIPTGLDNSTWQSTTSGAYAIYNDDGANDAIYGKLYNWFTTVDSRGLCPIGWHIPSDCEWMYLEGSIGMTVQQQQTEGYRGTNEGGAMKATTNWISPNTGSTNSSGFTGLPGGGRSNIGTYVSIGVWGFWWCSSDFYSGDAFVRLLNYEYSSVVRQYSNNIHGGFNVRCIRD
jgi:uncharacterized protein (TIGR02145 family)